MEEVAPDICALVAATSDKSKIGRLNYFVQAGVPAHRAADILAPYESVLAVEPLLFFDATKRELCEASAVGDQKKVKEITTIYIKPLGL